MIHLAIVNESTLVSQTEAAAATLALQAQVTEHYYPVWGTNAHLKLYSSLGDVPARSWVIHLLDDADVKGALGYHDFSSSRPLAKVFARTSQSDGVQWPSVASHEILEMLADPEGVLAALDYKTANFYSYEVCDPVEAYSYQINGVEVSDFVYPSWFTRDSAAPYDYLNKISAPFTLAASGGVDYTEHLNVSCSSGWQQITARSRYQVASEDD